MEINKIYNQDCFELLKKISDKSIDLILTDPPYGMNYQSNYRKEKFYKIKNDNNLDWFKPFAENSYRILKENSHIYIFCNDYSLTIFKKELEEAGFKLKRIMVWIKNNWTAGDLYGDYANRTEFILFAHKGRKLLNGRRDTNVLEFKRVSNLTHPTEKPIDLLSYLINKSSEENQLLLDPFAGSCSLAEACIKTKRNYICIEKEENYCKIGEERISKL